MEQILDVFSKNLKRIREKQDLTQEELSEKCHYDRTYIGKIERGQKYPSLDVISRLSSVLGVPSAELFMGPEDLPEVKYAAPRKDRLEMDESVYEHIFSSEFHILVLFDGEGTVLKVNNDLLEVLGRERESIEGTILWEWSLWQDDDARRLKQDVLSIREGKMVREQAVIPFPDENGSLTRLDLILTPRSESRDEIDYHVMEGFIDSADDGEDDESG